MTIEDDKDLIAISPDEFLLTLSETLREELRVIRPGYEQEKKAEENAKAQPDDQEKHQDGSDDNPESTSDDGSNDHVLDKMFADLSEQNLVALCFSGGGIRSATFGLGVLQSLANHKLLSRFDYLSTVSGGGYLGSWLSAWVWREHRRLVERQEVSRAQGTKITPEKLGDNVFVALQSHQNRSVGIVEVQDQLNSQQVSSMSNPSPEPRPVQHLREYSNYMSPLRSILSADTWTLIGIYLRNLLLNWTIFIPLIASVLLLPRFHFVSRFAVLDPDTIKSTSMLAFQILAVSIVFGSAAIAYVAHHLPSKLGRDSSKYSRDSSAVLLGVLPIVILALVVTTLWRVYPGVTEASPGSVMYFVGGYFALFAIGYVLRFVPDAIAWFRHGTKIVMPSKRASLYAAVASAIGGCLLWMIAHNYSTIRYLMQNWTSVSDYRTPLYVTLAVPVFLLLYLASLTLYVGLSSKISTDDDREWLARYSAWILMVVVIWIGIHAIVLFGPVLVEYLLGQVKDGDKFGFTVSGLISIISGVVSLVGGFIGATGKGERLNTGILAKVSAKIPQVAGIVFFVSILVTLAFLTTKLIRHSGQFFTLYTDNKAALTHLKVLAETPGEYVALMFLLFLAIGIVMACFVNVNKFSLHGAYRDRLVRAYLGASNVKRKPNPFTGFDETDNIQLHRIKGQRPFHVINATLNLVGGKKLAWQTRKAASFTMSALHCGSWVVGYRPTNRYSRNRSSGTCGDVRHCNRNIARDIDLCGQVCELPGKSIRLGTAMAISGAAANPNMGYYSSGVVTFLMTLFNIRLGWWLGNPGALRLVKKMNPETKQLEDKVETVKDFFYKRPFWEKASPAIAVLPLLNEMLGRTDKLKRYVNVTDGGHFENLGLYEMVLRRCRFIVLSDGAADADFKFGDIANAIRKCKVDLGVHIEFEDGISIYSRSADVEADVKKHRFSVATIHYPKSTQRPAEVGHLLYIKPTFYDDKDESMDIRNYANENVLFPHQSTGDQFYDELQFEAYRSLGYVTFESIMRSTDPKVQKILNGIRANPAGNSAVVQSQTGTPAGPPIAKKPLIPPLYY